ncbi:MerR family transcriptional regulator [Paraflavisolibacter sp. H34]|uniref:MerR family transcriptional regulator n=1 Tax=Huijunlia imazamoxiresistens TaxID=3127457 RepID=UPI003017AF76
MAFTIKELAALSGVKAHTIRIWEQRYNFLKPDRTATNIRTYSNEELKTLLTVALLNKHGYKISRIDEMTPPQRTAAALNLQVPEAEYELLINELIGLMVNVEQTGFQEVLDRHIHRHGLAKTITTVIFSFLEKVGILWQADSINPAQEHIVSNIIREKIIAGIDALPLVHGTEPLFLLFLPEDEHHELGLLYVYYLLKERSLPVIYLGANLPLDDLFYVVNKKKPAFLYLHLVSFPRQLHFEKFLTQLSHGSNGARILLSGPVPARYPKKFPANVDFLSSIQDLMEYAFSAQ